MNDKITIPYRDLELRIDRSLYDKFCYLKNRPLSTTDIDQYLVNESDKAELEPFNADMSKVLPQFTNKNEFC